jgi:hypothetical protein
MSVIYIHFLSKSLSTKLKKTDQPRTHPLTQPLVQVSDVWYMLAFLLNVPTLISITSQRRMEWSIALRFLISALNGSEWSNPILDCYNPIRLEAVRNLVSEIKGGTRIEGVWEQGAEENIWSEERWSGGRLEKTV